MSEHSSASVQALLSGAPQDLVHVQTELVKRFDDQHVQLCEAAKLAEELQDESKARRLRGPARRRAPLTAHARAGQGAARAGGGAGADAGEAAGTHGGAAAAEEHVRARRARGHLRRAVLTRAACAGTNTPRSPPTSRSAARARGRARLGGRGATDARLAPKPRQAKLTLQGPLGSSAAFKRDVEKRLQAFDRCVWVRSRDARSASAADSRVQLVNHSGPMPGEEDDGMWVEGTQDDLPPNVKCPLSGKALLDLKEPVRCVAAATCELVCGALTRLRTPLARAVRRRDQKGYVYEKATVMQYIVSYKGAPAKNPNAGACGCAYFSALVLTRLAAGVTAPITAAEMQPAKNVIRMQRRKQLASQQVRRHRGALPWRPLTHAPQGRVSNAHEDADVIE